jgi:CheY-like chemotaxis protein
MDDEDAVRLVVRELLRSLGHEAEVAEHGAAAVDRFREAREAGRPFDLVILDLTVRGGMGGLETVRRLREIDPGVKAVVSSGYSDDPVTSNYREHGFRSYLQKPYTAEGLSTVLDELLA